MNKIFSVLRFFTLMDPDSVTLSITNIAVIISVVKIAMGHTAPMDGGALLVTVLNYAHKRYTNSTVNNQPNGDTNA
jgi:hypothetical protein